MTIRHVANDLIRPAGAGKASDVDGKKDKDAPSEVARVERADRVEISDQGRALAEQAEPVAGAGQDLTPARAAAIQERIESGVYDRSDFAREVASRLLSSGDLDE